MREDKLKKLLDLLPKATGIYIMKDGRQRVVYVGKAKNLRSRVRSYFSPGSDDSRPFASHIRSLVVDIEIVLTKTEKEALLLENNLIKRHSPRFNIRLRDDKEYPALRLDIADKWPKLEIVRKTQNDGALYFGPYTSASAARETLRLVTRHFNLRSCTNRQMASRKRPCLQHQMHRCSGPCTLDVDPAEYRRNVEYARLFLLGRREDLILELKNRMAKASEEMAYEKAASLRDQIIAVEATLAPQRITSIGGVDQDVIGLCRKDGQLLIALLEFGAGRLTGRRELQFEAHDLPNAEILSSFAVQHYTSEIRIPKEVVVPEPLADAKVVAEILSDLRGSKVAVIHPRRGARLKRLEMANLNARQALESRLRDDAAVEEKLAVIQRRLGLPRPPLRIECIDISHIGGSDTAGSIAVVVNGKIHARGKRTFTIKNAPKGDDYAAIKEVLSRRFVRAQRGEKGWEAPDLLVVDGGRGQLAVAMSVLDELNISSQPVVALAKERTGSGKAESDRVYIPGRKNPIPVNASTSPLFLLAMARDEAHRTAGAFQRKLRHRRAFGSRLDSVPGVGPKIRSALLKKLGSAKRVGSASIEELCEVKGVSRDLARRIKEALGEP